MAERKPLSEVLDLVIDHRGKTPRKLGGDFTSEGVPVVSAINIKDNRITPRTEPRFVTEDMFERWMPVRTRKFDVLLTSEAPLGEVALVENDEPLVLSQRVFALRARRDVLDSLYLYYALRTQGMQARLAARSSGTTVLGIKQSELLKVHIEVPPLPQQRSIGRMLRAVDRKIDANLALIEHLEALLRVSFDKAFRQDTADSSIGALATSIRLGVQPGSVPAETRYIGLEHMPRGSVVLNDWGVAADVTSAKSQFAAGDILFGKLRPYFRKVGLATVDGICSSDIIVCRPKEERLRSYLLMVMSSDAMIKFADGASGGTRMPRVSWADLARFEVAVPEPVVLDRFERFAAPVLARCGQAVVENVHLRDLLTALLRTVAALALTPEEVRSIA